MGTFSNEYIIQYIINFGSCWSLKLGIRSDTTYEIPCAIPLSPGVYIPACIMKYCVQIDNKIPAKTKTP